MPSITQPTHSNAASEKIQLSSNQGPSGSAKRHDGEFATGLGRGREGAGEAGLADGEGRAGLGLGPGKAGVAVAVGRGVVAEEFEAADVALLLRLLVDGREVGAGGGDDGQLLVFKFQAMSR